jgi:hypothetical protein
MKDGCCHHNKWMGLFYAAFGVFFLVANLVPAHMEVLKYWPVFLIVGGLLKAFHEGFSKFLK